MKMSDDELVRQVKSVFEDYDDGLGEQGWTELRQKYPEKESKKLPIWWLTGIAATLLLIVGLYFGNAFDQEKVILQAGTIKKKNQSQENTITDKGNRTTNLDTASSKAYASQFNKKAQSHQEQPIIKSTTAVSESKVRHPKHTFNEGTVITQNLEVAQVKPSTAVENANLPAVNATKEDHVAPTTTIAKNAITEPVTKPKLSTEEFLKEQSKVLANSEHKNTKRNHNSKATLDIFTGTFFNYHDDNEAKLSAGLGLNANIKVAKNLVLSLGAGISQNKVSYENKVPVELSQAMFAARANSLVFDSPTNNATYSVTATNDVNFNGQLLSIDLPMVVKFFPSKKQDFYISTGINSSSYITQKYTYNYNLSNFGVRNGEAQPRQETEKSTFKGFDFANTAIIAIGINQNIGNNILIFEPYYKPALSTMGDKNLRISSAGLNLKFNFNGNLKK